jgi:hypothetical protein
MKLFLSTILILILVSCGPKGHFLISNINESKKSVDIKILFGDEEVFNDTVKWNNVRPDMRYTFDKSIAKGKRTITVIADSGKLKITKPIMMDSDRWIFIQFYDKRTANNRGCKFDIDDMDEYTRKSPDGIEINISDKELSLQ